MGVDDVIRVVDDLAVLGIAFQKSAYQP